MKLDIFATPIWIKDYSEEFDTSALLNLCNKIKDTDGGVINSNHNGWHSSHLAPESFEEIENFSHHVINQAELFLDEIGYDNSIYMSYIWFNINKENSLNIQHIHPRTMLSGVFYLSAPDGSGDLIFHRTSTEDYILSNFNLRRHSLNTTSIMKYKPIKNRLILFPAWIPHSVESNKTNEPRISIAFNITQK